MTLFKKKSALTPISGMKNITSLSKNLGKGILVGVMMLLF